MCHNPGTWYDSPQVKLTMNKIQSNDKSESQNPLGNNRVSLIWQKLSHCHLETIVPVTFGNNYASLTWKQMCQPHLEIIISSSLVYNRANLT